MNCHDDKTNSGNNEKESHSNLKHMFHMILCCAIPMILLTLLPLMKVNESINSVILSISPFICPVMMGLMMIMMFKGSKKKKCCSSDDLKEGNEISKRK